MSVPQVALTSGPLDSEALVALVNANGDGAVVTFAGLVRNHNQGRQVQFLEYEAYEPLATRALQRIVDEAHELWPGARVAVHHRLGRLEIGETAVLIVVAAPHRHEAFEDAEQIMDRIKQVAPIWKKEVWADGTSEWVGDEVERKAQL